MHDKHLAILSVFLTLLPSAPRFYLGTEAGRTSVAPAGNHNDSTDWSVDTNISAP